MRISDWSSDVCSSDLEATALWGKIRTTADYAALLKSTSAHSLDYDDTSGESHPSAVLFPALLAVGEPFATGKDVVSASIAGYEIWTELASRDRIKHHAKDFHPSGIFGAIGAGAACENLLRLDADRSAAAHDRKSTRLTHVNNAHVECRTLLVK